MAKSWRTAPLPSFWPKLRAEVLERDGYQCTELAPDGSRCTWKPLEVDHIGDPNDHRLRMLRTLCKYHHRRKTSGQGGRAKAEKRRSMLLEPEVHPSDIEGGSSG